MAAILALRENLHGLVQQITWPELRSALVLLAMTVIVLPIVPDQSFGPLGGVNPREVWLIAIVLACISFLGYAAVRYFGPQSGVLLAAAAGGLVSSTAVTLANARSAARHEGSPHLMAAGVALAAAISFLRVMAIVIVLKPMLAPLIVPPALAAAGVAGAFAFVSTYWRTSPDVTPTDAKLRNPFAFWAVIGFAVMLAIVMLISHAVSQSLGAAGAIVGAAVMGLTDVDAITVSMARLAPQTLSVTVAAYAILTAAASNTLAKIAIGAALGRGVFALEIAAMTLGCFVAGAAALWAAMWLSLLWTN
jgi:uncharacterized membrane protein (DUF4010 family)